MRCERAGVLIMVGWSLKKITKNTHKRVIGGTCRAFRGLVVRPPSSWNLSDGKGVVKETKRRCMHNCGGSFGKSPIPDHRSRDLGQ